MIRVREALGAAARSLPALLGLYDHLSSRRAPLFAALRGLGVDPRLTVCHQTWCFPREQAHAFMRIYWDTMRRYPGVERRAEQQDLKVMLLKQSLCEDGLLREMHAPYVATLRHLKRQVDPHHLLTSKLLDRLLGHRPA
jgi:hypothetical protein